ncbi:MAG: hypothetical protein H6721_18875 [Sandaracinus sp.]|nr:hypothetical protein [Sandaracinus sp.]
MKPHLALLVGLALVSCSSEPRDSNATETSSGAEADAQTSGVRAREDHEIPRAPGVWAEMSHDEKGRFMAEAVVPYMRELFREYDSERYASFGCATCHGREMSARGFEMPSPDLLALHPSGSPEQQAVVENHPRMTRFMFNHVVPAMRTMLGQEAYDAETGEGFSCYTCHPRAE